MSRRARFSHRTSLALGLGFTLAGVFLLRDAYEHRGKPRPLWLTFWPGG